MSNHEREGSRSPAADDALDRAWQQLSDEQPPPSLDAAIIAAARSSTANIPAILSVFIFLSPFRGFFSLSMML